MRGLLRIAQDAPRLLFAALLSCMRLKLGVELQVYAVRVSQQLVLLSHQGRETLHLVLEACDLRLAVRH